MPQPSVTSASPTPTLRLSAWVGLVAVLALFAALCWIYDFIQDDTYITLQYARNLVRGHGPIYNLGERVEGYTSPSWMLLSAGTMALGLEPVTAAKTMGVALGLASLILLFLIGRELQPSRAARWALIAPLLMASNGAFALWSTSGMESAAFVFTLLLGIRAYLRERNGSGRGWSCGLLFALAALTRPEGMLFFGLTWLHRLAERWKRGEHNPLDALRWALPFLIPVGLHLAWRWSYYGHPLPNTFYAKTGWSWTYLSYGMDYGLDFVRKYALWGAAIVLPAVVLRTRARRVPVGYLYLLFLVHAGYVVLIGGDVLLENRFFLPALPLLYLLVQEAIARIPARGWLAPPRSRALLSTALVLGFAACTILIPHRALQSAGLANSVGVAKFLRAGEWIAQNTSPDASVATIAAGAVAWTSERTVIDMFGLNDETVAHRPETIEGLVAPTKEQSYNAEYVLSRRPEIIYFLTGSVPSSLAEKALFCKRDFRQNYWLYKVSDVIYMYRRRERSPTLPPEMSQYRDVSFVEDFCEGSRRVGRYPEAALEWLLRSVRNAPPDFALLYEEVGLSYLQLGRPAEATGFFERALQANDSSTRSHFGMGVVGFEAGDLESAVLHLRRATELWPDYGLAQYYLGLAARRNQQLDEAEAAFRVALRSPPTRARSALELGLLLHFERGDDDAALPLLELFLGLSPTDDEQRRRIQALVAQLRTG